MKLMIGGLGQGMRELALTRLGPDALVADGASCCAADALTAAVFDNLHLFIRRELLSGRDAAAAVLQIVQSNPGLLILCTEIGCGVVPLDRFEREWREQTGRICCLLAQRAERVERIFCGLSIIIKGEPV